MKQKKPRQEKEREVTIGKTRGGIVNPMEKKRRFSFMKTALPLSVILLGGCKQLIVLDPKGPIGIQEAFLIKIAFVLMLIVVIPVFILAFLFSIKYRASNVKAHYMPQWTNSAKIELVIWLVPIAIIATLSYLTWIKTHELDPYKPILSDEKPVRVEVISTDWNWLFLYPDYHVAVANQLVFPVKAPLSLRLTSASVMTSFFIPQLGSQMYVMAGMQTRLNLMANEPGSFLGQNQEYSGNGYNTMHFKAAIVSRKEFEQWLQTAQRSPDTLNFAKYEQFSKPNTDYPVTSFTMADTGLFDRVMGASMDWMGKDDCCEKKTCAMHREHQSKNTMSDSPQGAGKIMEMK